MSTPRGMRPPSFWNLEGSRRNSTISVTSFLRLIAAGDIGEGDVVVVLVEHAGLGLAKGEGTTPAATLHLTHKEDPDPDEQQHGEPGHENAHQEGWLLLGLAETDTPYFMRSETIQRSCGALTVMIRSSVVCALTMRPSMLAERMRPCRALFHELGVGDFGAHALAAVELPEHGEEHKANHHPNGNLRKRIVQLIILSDDTSSMSRLHQNPGAPEYLTKTLGYINWPQIASLGA